MVLLSIFACVAIVPPGLQPSSDEHHARTYCSPTGAWRVHVEPNRSGGEQLAPLSDDEGSTLYRAEHHGEHEWETRLPFTLRDAVVDESGYLAGYAYEVNKERTKTWSVTTVIAPSGEALVGTPTWREYRQCMQPTGPPVYGLLLDAEHSRFVVRACDGWVVRDLATGTQLAAFDLDAGHVVGSEHQPFPRVVAARAIPGTELYVTVGVVFRFDRQPREHDLVIELFDADGHSLGSRTHPWEFPARWSDIDGSAILDSFDEGFVVWLPNSSTRVEYSVDPGATGSWRFHDRTWSVVDPAEQLESSATCAR